MPTGVTTCLSPTTACRTSSSETSTASGSRRRRCWPASRCPASADRCRPGVAVGGHVGRRRADVPVTALKGKTSPLYVNDSGMAFHDGTRPAPARGSKQSAQRLGMSLVDLDDNGRPDIVTGNSRVDDPVDESRPRAAGRPTPSCSIAATGSRTRPRRPATRSVAPSRRIDGWWPSISTTRAAGHHDDRLGGPVEESRNSGPAGRWLRIVLRGRVSNRDGRGAIVTANGRR